MDAIYTHCAGLDVHKVTVVACCLSLDAQGHKVKATETFGTSTSELLRLSDWLTASRCTHVAMESTGVYCPTGIPWGEADLEYSRRQF
jgi:transposase